jgi:F-type H+-transporting ATPase subunit b
MRIARIITISALLLTIGSPVVMAAADHAAPTEQPVVVSVEEGSTENLAGPAFATGEAENPVEAAEDHGGGGLPQLRLETYASQAFWLLITFAALYLSYSKMILPSIGSVIGAREDKIKGDLDAAESLRAQAEAIRLSYEQGLEQARADARAAIAEVEAASKKQAEDRANDFRKKSEADITAAESRMDDVRAKALGDMTAVAAEVASVAAEKITGVSADVQKAKAIVETIAGKAKAA